MASYVHMSVVLVRPSIRQYVSQSMGRFFYHNIRIQGKAMGQSMCAL